MSGPDTRSAEIDPDLLSSIEEHAVSLAASAGELLLDYFHRDMKVEYKSEGSRSPVSDADKGAEQLIVDGIRSRFPGHGVLSEETPPAEDLDRDFVWVIDPLDGTTNFVNGLPVFASSIGVLHRASPSRGPSTPRRRPHPRAACFTPGSEAAHSPEAPPSASTISPN